MMEERLLALALEKERLRLQSAALRAELGRNVSALGPLFVAGERVRAGALWLRRHPETGVGVVLLLTLLKPAFVWRWARRGVLVWLSWRKLARWAAAGKGR